jgi:hypothetical protein
MIWNLVVTGLLAALLAACGGGGGSGGGAAASSVGGVAAAGLVRNGVIKAYAVDALTGAKGALLGTTTTDANGAYSLSLGSYAGAVLVELEGAAGGISKYTDEATNTDVTLTAGAVFLRAAVANVLPGTPVTVALTPLTELAVQRATTGGTTPVAAIAAANTVVSDLFGVDIVGVRPVAPTVAAMGAAGVTDAQRTYALVLAGLSQQAGAATTAAMAGVITALNGGINAGNVMSGATATTLATAVNAYVDGANDTTNLSSASPLVTALTGGLGQRSATLVLNVTGVTGQNVYGLNALQVTMPASGYIVSTDSNTNLVTAADVAATTGGTVTAAFVSPVLTISVGSGTVITDGVVSVKLLVNAGFDVTAIQVSSPLFRDLNGAALVVPGASVTRSVN